MKQCPICKLNVLEFFEKCPNCNAQLKNNVVNDVTEPEESLESQAEIAVESVEQKREDGVSVSSTEDVKLEREDGVSMSGTEDVELEREVGVSVSGTEDVELEREVGVSVSGTEDEKLEREDGVSMSGTENENVVESMQTANEDREVEKVESEEDILNKLALSALNQLLGNSDSEISSTESVKSKQDENTTYEKNESVESKAESKIDDDIIIKPVFEQELDRPVGRYIMKPIDENFDLGLDEEPFVIKDTEIEENTETVENETAETAKNEEAVNIAVAERSQEIVSVENESVEKATESVEAEIKPIVSGDDESTIEIKPIVVEHDLELDTEPLVKQLRREDLEEPKSSSLLVEPLIQKKEESKVEEPEAEEKPEEEKPKIRYMSEEEEAIDLRAQRYTMKPIDEDFQLDFDDQPFVIMEAEEKSATVEEEKAEPKAEIQPEAVEEEKAEPEAEVKPEVVEEEKAEPEAEIQPEAAEEEKAEPEAEVKPEVVEEEKAEPKAEIKPIVVEHDLELDIEPVVKQLRREELEEPKRESLLVEPLIQKQETSEAEETKIAGKSETENAPKIRYMSEEEEAVDLHAQRYEMKPIDENFELDFDDEPYVIPEQVIEEVQPEEAVAEEEQAQVQEEPKEAVTEEQKEEPKEEQEEAVQAVEPEQVAVAVEEVQPEEAVAEEEQAQVQEEPKEAVTEERKEEPKEEPEEAVQAVEPEQVAVAAEEAQAEEAVAEEEQAQVQEEPKEAVTEEQKEEPKEEQEETVQEIEPEQVAAAAEEAQPEEAVAEEEQAQVQEEPKEAVTEEQKEEPKEEQEEAVQAVEPEQVAVATEEVQPEEAVAEEVQPEPVDKKMTMSKEELLESITELLAQEDWAKADEYCERVLDINPENAEAYLAKLMIDYHVSKRELIVQREVNYSNNANYKKAHQYGSDALKQELENYLEEIKRRIKEKENEEKYQIAISCMDNADTPTKFKNAKELFSDLGEYKDSKKLAEQCDEKMQEVEKDEIYDAACLKLESGQKEKITEAMEMFESIRGWKDSIRMVRECRAKLEAIKVNAYNGKQKVKRGALNFVKFLVAIAICGVVAMAAYIYLLPQVKYNNAMDMLDKGKYKEACKIFKELGDLKDSKKALEYGNAMILFEDKKYEEAYSVFRELGDYKSCKTRLAVITKTLVSEAMVGDVVQFGTYEQDNDTSNGAEDIEWIVLAKEEERALLISKKVLDGISFNSEEQKINWQKSSMRAWLNGNFMSSAFSEEEKSIISITTNTNPKNSGTKATDGEDTKEQIFLFSIKDMKQYYNTNADRIAEVTTYALQKQVVGWWLRTPGKNQTTAAFVDATGTIQTNGQVVSASNIGIRPALWMRLN